jgi:hypothetical protein
MSSQFYIKGNNSREFTPLYNFCGCMHSSYHKNAKNIALKVLAFTLLIS